MIIHIEFELPDPVRELRNYVTSQVLSGQTFDHLNGDLIGMLEAEKDRVWYEHLQIHGDWPRKGTIQFGTGPYKKIYIFPED